VVSEIGEKPSGAGKERATSRSITYGKRISFLNDGTKP